MGTAISKVLCDENGIGGKDFAAADAVYAELKNLGIVVNDNTKTWRMWSETSGLRPMDNPLF